MTQLVTLPGPVDLSGTLFPAARPKAFAVINTATGVPQSFYRHFAAWLAEEHQVTTLTYDYRDFGASATGPMRRSRATLADWGITDADTARRWATTQAGDLPLWVIGHSLGALMLGWQSDLERIDRLIGVCSGPVHHTDHPWPFRAQVLALWHLVGPISTTLFGYVPKQLTGLGTDLPAPLFRQWRHWCTTEGFEATDPTLPRPDSAALTGQLRSVALSDDLSVPPDVVARLGPRYPQMAQTHVVLNPADYGLGKIGHAAAFSRHNAALWPDIIG